MKEFSPPPQENESQSTNKIPKVRFEPGEVVITHEANFSLAIRDRHPFQLLARHVEGDWGDIDEHDKMENEQSADLGSGRITSVYDIEDARFYVMTESDRSVTTILLPEEY
jgi:hypothetical protein